MTATAPVRTRSPRILDDATAEQLADAVELNQREWIRFQGRLPDAELHDDPDVTWIGSRSPGRSNTVALARFDAPTAARRIRTILAGYARLDASTVWWVGRRSSPADLGRRLREAGFHCFKHFPGMALDIARMQPPVPAPRGLKTFELRDFDLFREHPHPYFGPITTERRENLLDGERRLCAACPRRLYAFVAAMDGVPLGHAMVFLGGGVAGIYDVGTLPAARRRGIGTTVTVAAIEHARSLGYRYAVLKASGEGERIYRRIGFIEASRTSLWFHSRRYHAAVER